MTRGWAYRTARPTPSRAPRSRQRGFQDADHWILWVFFGAVVWLIAVGVDQGLLAALVVGLMSLGALIGVFLSNYYFAPACQRWIDALNRRLFATPVYHSDPPGVEIKAEWLCFVVVLVSASLAYGRFLAPAGAFVQIVFAPAGAWLAAAAFIGVLHLALTILAIGLSVCVWCHSAMQRAFGMQALLPAIFQGQSEYALQCIAPIADAAQLGPERDEMLVLAAERGMTSVVERLLEIGVPVDAVGKAQLTSLHMAARVGAVDVVQCLAKRGANLDAVDPEGYTPLHMAVMYRQQAALDALLALGADPSIPNMSKKTPLQLAVLVGADALAQILQERTGAGANGDA